jgi:predicted RecA/RadA family phage recombinase
MSRSYVQPGDTLTLVAPYDVAAGAGFLVGTLFSVAAAAALSGAAVEGMTVGVHTGLAKIGSQAWTAGAAVYWDNTNKRLTTVASGNTLVGCALDAVGSGAGETTAGRVRLNGVARPAEA